MSIKIEVSLGEAIDKLTILDIKQQNIMDHRKNDILKEYHYLFNELTNYINDYKYLYDILFKINLKIWKLMDIIRNNIDKETYCNLCNETINLNDARFLIKKKINEVSISNFKEQKGYNIRVLNIILNCDLNIINGLNGAIRYYSLFYDEINLYVVNENKINIATIFKDDPFIKILTIDDITDTKNDTITIIDDDIIQRISHSYFINKTINITNTDNLSKIETIYYKLNLDFKIHDDYKN
jgi:hypothetical protein